MLAVARSVVASGDYPIGSPTVTVSGTSTLVLVPEPYLERIVGNLVEDNARRFGLSRVEVLVHQRGKKAVLEVHDDGPGVPPHERTRVFERFVRLDEARDRENGGFGLGLAIVSDLCRAFGGTIEVSDANPGAVFSAQFPVARAGLAPAPESVPTDLLEPAGR